jgi:hypothetical protein
MGYQSKVIKYMSMPNHKISQFLFVQVALVIYHKTDLLTTLQKNPSINQPLPFQKSFKNPQRVYDIHINSSRVYERNGR